MKSLVRINPKDNVLMALRDLSFGEILDGLRLLEDIPAGHKVASEEIPPGASVTKFGYPIGVANCIIRPGEHVHTHNVGSALRGNIENVGFQRNHHFFVTPSRKTMVFQGFRRPEGQAGVRNEIWVINTVACVNHVAECIAEQARRQWVKPDGPVEGIYAFPHPYGCSQLGDDLRNTGKTLAGLVNHPNAAAVLVLGLGCENNQIKLLLNEAGPVDPYRVRFFNAQEVDDEIDEGLRLIGELAEYASQFKRELLPARKLVLAMKCGGSDGFSGITANPLVGLVADWMSAAGATTLLSEVPEIFGAEEILLARAIDHKVFNSFTQMVNEFRDYFRAYNQPIDENPSPGNKEGGITTLAEKSLGCVQKGGRAPISQVLVYGQPAKPESSGLALVNAPGNDGVSGTALTIAGAHMLLFTTGRGTPMGFPVPTLKIATNTQLAQRKSSWIDFDAGRLLDSRVTLEELAEELLGLVLKVASGEVRTQNEKNGYRDIAIWKTGVTV
jgi:altronate hydrolase